MWRVFNTWFDYRYVGVDRKIYERNLWAQKVWAVSNKTTRCSELLWGVPRTAPQPPAHGKVVYVSLHGIAFVTACRESDTSVLAAQLKTQSTSGQKMSKAFTKENDVDGDETEAPLPALPGGKNYITPQGLHRLQREFSELKFRERPEVTKVVQWAAGNGDRSENGDYLYGKKRLREIDKRLRYLAKHIESAEVIDPGKVRSDTVKFGATVTIRDEEEQERTYSIVGVDEIDINKGRISWMSPLATALMRSREGDFVTFRFPKGVQQLEVIKIEYRAIDS